ncbi:MAG: CRISPR system precrRNA processing endoribonuclease RAMP protein Cas6 [Chlorobiaceae bacterium]|nr:CRISPR system precrRNA processing endoribonuclease RAMP protein Cas6 [Chlorobiaceae bacterium]
MYTPLSSLRIARFRFTIEPLELVQLPDYKGSALRGGFGHAFKRATCLSRDRQCEPCILKSACAYHTVFETKVSQERADRLRIGADAPHPFLIEPPMTGQHTFRPGDSIRYGVTLFGTAIDKLPFFIYAFMILGENLGLGKGRGRFRLVSVEDDAGRNIYDNGNLVGPVSVAQSKDILESAGTSDHELSLEFLTPLRIRTAWKRQEQELLTGITGDGDFRLLLKSLYHRAFVLSQLYGERSETQAFDSRNMPLFDGDVRLVESKTRWLDWTRYSQRQQQPMQLGGIMGNVTFTGKTGRYYPLFRLGEYLHMGKGTTFGLGKYRLTENRVEP